MVWLANNWIWIALVVGMAAMHLFGHGHGGHRHRSRQGADGRPQSDASVDRELPPANLAGDDQAPVAATPAPAGEDKHRHNNHRHGS